MAISMDSLLRKRKLEALSLFTQSITAPEDITTLRTNYLYEQEYAPYLQTKEFIDRTRRLKMLGQIGLFPQIQENAKTQAENNKEANNAELQPEIVKPQCEALVKVVDTHMHSSLKSRKIKPKYHPQWKLMRVISGHQGWVRCIAVDPNNQFFASGGNDRTIKFWDLATGQLKITLTGHINTIRSMVLSDRHPYLFSCGDDKQIKCWDLEYNKAIRSYHGHLSGVTCITLHPTQEVLVTGGRDSTARMWDIRTKHQVQVFVGHTDIISAIGSQEFEPQLITGSHDKTIRFWDIIANKTVQVLTNHKKGIRSLAMHTKVNSFCSAGADKIRYWKFPEGEFLRSSFVENQILNCIALNGDNVLAAGENNGNLHFFDYETGMQFQTIKSMPQPGSLSSEAGIFGMAFDRSSLRLLTAECDKTIKVWKEDIEINQEDKSSLE